MVNKGFKRANTPCFMRTKEERKGIKPKNLDHTVHPNKQKEAVWYCADSKLREQTQLKKTEDGTLYTTATGSLLPKVRFYYVVKDSKVYCLPKPCRVVSDGGVLHLAPRNVGVTVVLGDKANTSFGVGVGQHSSFFCGEPVDGAGCFYATTKKGLVWTNWATLYRPSIKQGGMIERWCKTNGVPYKFRLKQKTFESKCVDWHTIKPKPALPDSPDGEGNDARKLANLCCFPEQVKKEKVLGSGGFGLVYKGTFEKEEVAIKVLNDQNSPTRIGREILSMAKCVHENILRLYGYYFEGGNICLIIELCLSSLDDYYEAHRDDLTLHERLTHCCQIASGLEFLHSNDHIHRDLKPANILIGEDNKLKLADFGLSRKTPARTERATVCGTPGFMAPELEHGLGRYGTTSRVDIYSFGVVMQWLFLDDFLVVPASVNLMIREATSEVPAERPDISSLLKRLKAAK